MAAGQKGQEEAVDVSRPSHHLIATWHTLLNLDACSRLQRGWQRPKNLHGGADTDNMRALLAGEAEETRAWCRARTTADLSPVSMPSSRYHKLRLRSKQPSSASMLETSFRRTRANNIGPSGSPCCTPDCELIVTLGCYRMECES